MSGFVDYFRMLFGWKSSVNIQTTPADVALADSSRYDLALTNASRYTLTLTNSARYDLSVTNTGDPEG